MNLRGLLSGFLAALPTPSHHTKHLFLLLLMVLRRQALRTSGGPEPHPYSLFLFFSISHLTPAARRSSAGWTV